MLLATVWMQFSLMFCPSIWILSAYFLWFCSEFCWQDMNFATFSTAFTYRSAYFLATSEVPVFFLAVFMLYICAFLTAEVWTVETGNMWRILSNRAHWTLHTVPDKAVRDSVWFRKIGFIKHRVKNEWVKKVTSDWSECPIGFWYKSLNTV